MLTEEERYFLLNLINNITIKPSQNDATLIINLVNSIIAKLSNP